MLSAEGSSDVHEAMPAVPGHGSRTGALQRHHSLNCDITEVAKCPPEKQTGQHLTAETLCMDRS